MSRKKIFFPVALIILITASLSFSFYTFTKLARSSSQSTAYVEPEEVKEYFRKREENRKAASVTIIESRKIASDWIKKERLKISKTLYYRRRSYELIAKAILTSESYEELNYHLARLPKTEKQAYATLTIDHSNITTLDHYAPSIPGLLYPIQLPGKENNGKDLLITSYFTNKRVSPLGSGGVKPHLAVDIINIGNIEYVSEQGELVRDGNDPGSIVSVADGVVKSIEYNHIYGWNIVVEHDKNLIPYQRRRGVESFETFYAHLNKNILVKKGEAVVAGQKLGTLGNTGLSTGPHLHFEIRVENSDGKTVHLNPYPGSEW